MKYINVLLIVFVLSFFNCKTPKETATGVDNNTTNNSNEHKNSNDAKKDLLVILEPQNTLQECKSYITNSGLNWKKIAHNSSGLKIAIIEVPAEKKDFWISRLEQSGGINKVTSFNEKSLAQIIEKQNNNYLSFNKTACFGTCPIYKLSITKDGKAEFFGEKFVLKTGHVKFQLSTEDIQELQKLLNIERFSNYAQKYDNPNITDLPSTYITYQNRQIQIRIWKDVPENLINIHEFLEKILLRNKFIE